MGEYGRRIVVDIPFERAVAETSEAIRAEGFDLVSTIDLRDYLAKHAHHDCRRYLLLGALLPQLALDALREDPELGPLLPTTIAIYELPDGETAVAASPSLSPVVFEFGWRAGRPAHRRDGGPCERAAGTRLRSAATGGGRFRHHAVHMRPAVLSIRLALAAVCSNAFRTAPLADSRPVDGRLSCAH